MSDGEETASTEERRPPHISQVSAKSITAGAPGSCRRSFLPRVGSKSRREHRESKYRVGRWSKEERLLLLKGLRAYGWGKWKEIGGTYLRSRSCIQINSYAQKVKQKTQGSGVEELMNELLEAEESGMAPPSPEHVIYFRGKYAPQLPLHETLSQQRNPNVKSSEGLDGNMLTFVPGDGCQTSDKSVRLVETATRDEMMAALAICSLTTDTSGRYFSRAPASTKKRADEDIN